MKNTIFNKMNLLAGAATVCFLFVPLLSGGEFQRAIRVAGGETVELVQDEVEDDGESGEGKYMGGAMLKTDPDLAALLKKADEYKNDGNYQVAAKYWQAVLERSGDTLYSEDGETYYAMTERVELILAELPDEGLRAYRISADASAKEIMAQARGEYDVEILSKIVRTYFISSLGDDAAYRLAGILMDQYDFVAATRLYRKITDQYPAPSVSLGDVWLKLAIAYSYLGDQAMASQAVNKATDIGVEDSSATREVSSLIEASPKLKDDIASAGDWTMRMGGARRFGVMASLPPETLNGDLAALWQYGFSPVSVFDEKTFSGKVLTGQDAWDSEKVKATIDSPEKQAVEKWRSKQWRPAGQLLVTDSDVIFKTGGDVTVWNRNPGDEPRWRPLWFNHFTEDEGSQNFRQMVDAYSRGNKYFQDQPSTPTDIQYFGDQVHQSMSVYRDVLYNVEGSEVYVIGGKPPKGNSSRQGYQYGQMPRRSRTNALTAYDMNNGKLLWRQPPAKLHAVASGEKKAELTGEEAVNPFDGIGFMSAPVGIGELLLVPVTQSGSVSIYALSANDGNLVWKAYLCDEPTGGSQMFSPMEISVQGSSAYVTCGTGVVFSIDPLAGTIQYARRYERSGIENANLANMGITGQVMMDGWEIDLTLPVGNLLLMFSSDYNAIWAIDRQTAQFMWKTENRPFNSKFDYLIGVLGDMIYLGGKDSIAAISIQAQGRWEWVEEFGDEVSFGRAMLTPDGIYVPIEDSIARFSLNGKNGRGEQLNRVGVRLGSSAPVGNLYNDGEKIWVQGANRLYVLGPAPPIENESIENESEEDITEDAEKSEADKDGSKPTDDQ